MTGGRVRPLALAALIVTLAGCGAGGGRRTPELAHLPLVGGARIVAQAQRCDAGANAFCSVELVVVDSRYRSSEALLNGEHDRLRSVGWTGANGYTGDEHAADSPGHKLRVTYATADGDLKGVDLGWIQRTRTITLALSRALFNREPALSVLLEIGSG
jgi:hypothetical protein